MNINLYNIAFASYILACTFYFIHSIFKTKNSGKIATLLLSIGLTSNTIYLAQRWSTAKHFPIVGLYESLIFFVWAMVLVYFILERIYKFRLLGIPLTLLAVLAWGWTSILDKSIQPLLPALKSNWLTIHVSSYFIGYGCLAVSFICSLTYLFSIKKTSSSRSKLDNLSYRLISLAFPFLTLGLTTGAVWAKTAWGAYWSWDPKETWALITWLIYASYLHLRAVKHWQGNKAAWVNMLGFFSVLFTFLGVNYLLPGLHSYMK